MAQRMLLLNNDCCHDCDGNGGATKEEITNAPKRFSRDYILRKQAERP